MHDNDKKVFTYDNMRFLLNARELDRLLNNNWLLILDLDEQCNYPHLDVLPAKIITYSSSTEKKELFMHNIILGSNKTICLK